MIPLPQPILLVDDDDRFRERLALALRDRGHQVFTAPGPETAVALAGQVHPGCAVLDLKMPGGGGLRLLTDLLLAHPNLRVVMLTGFGSIATAVEAIRAGALDYLTKPTDADAVLAALVGREDTSIPEDYEPPSLARTEYEHIQRVLDDCDGNISHAARKLGLHRRTLQRKLATMPPRR